MRSIILSVIGTALDLIGAMFLFVALPKPKPGVPDLDSSGGIIDHQRLRARRATGIVLGTLFLLMGTALIVMAIVP